MSKFQLPVQLAVSKATNSGEHQSGTGEHQKISGVYIYTFLEMPQRKQLSEEELEEIRNLRGQMPVKEIQTKYGIGSPRLYKIWREASQKQEAVQKKEEPGMSNEQLTKIGSLLKDIQLDSHQSDVKPQVDVPEYNINHLSDNYLLLQMHNKVEDMNRKLERIQEILEQAQDEVESVASDVEDIEDKVDDVEITTNTITGLSRNIYEATKTVEQIVYYGTIAVAIVGMFATTLKYVHWTKKDSFAPESKPVINANPREPFDLPTANPDLFDM